MVQNTVAEKLLIEYKFQFTYIWKPWFLLSDEIAILDFQLGPNQSEATFGPLYFELGNLTAIYFFSMKTFMYFKMYYLDQFGFKHVCTYYEKKQNPKILDPSNLNT